MEQGWLRMETINTDYKRQRLSLSFQDILRSLFKKVARVTERRSK